MEILLWFQAVPNRTLPIAEGNLMKICLFQHSRQVAQEILFSMVNNWPFQLLILCCFDCVENENEIIFSYLAKKQANKQNKKPTTTKTCLRGISLDEHNAEI